VPKEAQSSNPIVVLGGGPGLVCVLLALRRAGRRLTAIVSIAREADDDSPPRVTGGEVGDLRRSLEVLGDEEVALLRAIRRPLRVEGLGRHPLGNLALAAAADALGDYGQASIWLGEQLGIDGAVLPATVEPERAESPEDATAAIMQARWVLLAPGALYRSVLSTSAVPDLAAALRSTSARVVWIANLEPDPREAPNLSGIEHLGLLRRHHVRVDVVLYDPSAPLAFDPVELERTGVEPVSRPLHNADDPGVHDPERLRSALVELFDAGPGTLRRGTSPRQAPSGS
jgi:2-phospho-L-lactate transferase/gluconeogenesis factor (CofD/UPF0052 family)